MAGIEIRLLEASEHADAVRFYEAQGYTGGIADADTALAAFDASQIVGVVRIAPEHGTQLLRGMFIDAAYQRRGTGLRMLHALAAHMTDADCWLTCPPHLYGFYGSIGFAPVADADAPPHLAERAEGYRALHGPQGLMRRAPGGRASPG